MDGQFIVRIDILSVDPADDLRVGVPPIPVFIWQKLTILLTVGLGLLSSEHVFGPFASQEFVSQVL